MFLLEDHCPQRVVLRFGERAHLRLARRIVGHRAEIVGLLAGGAQRGDRLDDRRKLGILSRESRALFPCRRPFGRERGGEGAMADEHPIQALLEARAAVHRAPV